MFKRLISVMKANTTTYLAFSLDFETANRLCSESVRPLHAVHCKSKINV